MTTSLLAFCLIVPAGALAAGMLLIWIITHGVRRERLYDLLYSLRWGDTTTDNYGFAPAETGDPECFQLQLYAELLKLLGRPRPGAGVERVLEISCGRGGGLRHVALRLPGASQMIGLISRCTRSGSAGPATRLSAMSRSCAAMRCSCRLPMALSIS